MASIIPTLRKTEDLLSRPSPVEYHSGQRTSQLHILSTEEEVEQATENTSSPEENKPEVPPSISPSGIKLASEEAAKKEVREEESKDEDGAEAAASTPAEPVLRDDESTATSISQQSAPPQTLNKTREGGEPNSSMSRVTSRTPSTGSESLQNQVSVDINVKRQVMFSGKTTGTLEVLG